MDLKQVIVVRQDLKLPKGKLAAQVAHASAECALLSSKHEPEKLREWRQFGAKKIVLKVPGEKELLQFFQRAKDEGLVTYLISDAGKTVIAPGTKTCFGIGPDEEEKIDRVTGDLQMM
ncbi:peptidyl-tRNA hydrolase [Candidatus Woesearchaeota archaeon]|nr:peptidyl-tRNA hydrolase [Candidatus Woesearchaeota archaeon]